MQHLFDRSFVFDVAHVGRPEPNLLIAAAAAVDGQRVAGMNQAARAPVEGVRTMASPTGSSSTVSLSKPFTQATAVLSPAAMR